jgi:hypothetical protein
MFPFPSPNESMNRALEGTEQQELENEMLDSQNETSDLPQTDRGGAETKMASEETLESDKK